MDDGYKGTPRNQWVRADVEVGFVTREGAARDYGVAIADDGRVDAAATEALRRSRRHDKLPREFDVGPERTAWESVFDDATMLELNRRLMTLPKSVRQDRRRRIFERVVPGLTMAGAGGTIAQAIGDADAARVRLARAMEEILPPASTARAA